MALQANVGEKLPYPDNNFRQGGLVLGVGVSCETCAGKISCFNQELEAVRQRWGKQLVNTSGDSPHPMLTDDYSFSRPSRIA
ncbi:hypothetical protein [Paraburkholderia fungorum]|uniref:hypothetical protein n=1 Tax=Paraburkholderia fungorum TaxID=134537 RepID=UPI0009422009|nr:hypothetical protein [Paraburkholderia fungorum]